MEMLIFMIYGSRIIKKALCFKGFLPSGRGGAKSCENGKWKHASSMIFIKFITKHWGFHENDENHENRMLKTYEIRNEFYGISAFLAKLP